MINRREGIRAMKRGLLAVFLVLTISSVGRAGPLDVVIKPYPVIQVGFINTSYNATTGAFSANGFALTLATDSLSQQPVNSPFRILATISREGVATNGNMFIGSVTAPLLSGLTLLGFAFEPRQGGTLEFLFGDVGGSYVPGIYSGAATEPIDVMLTVGNTFLGSFNTSWSSTSNTAQVRADPIDGTLPNSIPEPSVLLMTLAGAGALYGRLRQRGASV